jgi:DnaJ-class molecular chaperone
MRFSKILMFLLLILYTRSALLASAHKIHEMLDLEKTATQGEVSSAFKKVSLIYHPDKTDDPEKQEYFKEMSNAYTDFMENGDSDQTSEEGWRNLCRHLRGDRHRLGSSQCDR